MGSFCSLPDLVEVVRRATSVVLLTHNDPDGDGIGSQLALSRGLRTLGKTVRIVNVGRLQPAYAWLLNEGEVEFYPRGGPFPERLEADLLIGLDFNGWDRLLDFASVILSSGISTAVLDHHPSDVASSDHTWVDTTAAATGIMVCDLLEALGVTIGFEMALPAYVSMVTDTGGFRFSNTDRRAHELAGRLIETGIRPADVNRRVYECSSEARLRLMARCLGRLETRLDGRIAWITVTGEDLAATGATPEDTEGFMDVVRTLDTLEVGLMFRVTEDGKIKMHMRSRADLNASDFARRHGGGGHPRAAGSTFDEPMEVVVPRVISDLESLLS